MYVEVRPQDTDVRREKSNIGQCVRLGIKARDKNT
jgi:hypothetical protein